MMRFCTVLDPRFKNLPFLEVPCAAETEATYTALALRIQQLRPDPAAPGLQPAFAIAPARPQPENFDIISKITDSHCKSVAMDSELARFLSMPVCKGVDPLQWWKGNEAAFPTIARLAKRFLCIPTASALSQEVFKMNCVVVKYHENSVNLPFSHLPLMQANEELLRKLD